MSVKGISALPAPKSQHRGVYWDKTWAKWSAEINRNYVKVRLGRFDTEDEAAEAYRLADQFLAGGGDPEKLKSLKFKAIRKRKSAKAWRKYHNRYMRAWNRKRKEQNVAQAV